MAGLRGDVSGGPCRFDVDTAALLGAGEQVDQRQGHQARYDQLGSLGLALNAVVLWNSRYLNAAADRLRAEGHEVQDEDMARLSPLGSTHLNVLGRYSFSASQPGEGLRPLRDSATPEDNPQEAPNQAR
ncbi:Tn3 family transposase [Streptacidiphilus sp. EB129]|uniref:Tn3 family transposase n=1 Tax=Streptacidiphilus sp. EB129 TaxID=3156262 RepID=UPI0035179642